MAIEDIRKIIEEIPEDELIILHDVVKEKLDSDHAIRLAKIPDLANPEFSVFDNRKIDKISPKVIDIRRRRYVSFVYYYSHPDRTDDQMISFIQMTNPDMSYIEAIRDLSCIKLVIGNMPKARRDLIRYQEIEMHKRAYQKAIEKDNEMAMTIAARNMGKAAGDDNLEIPWDEAIPPQLEPSSDISIINPERKVKTPKEIDAQITKMRVKYLDDVEDIEP